MGESNLEISPNLSLNCLGEDLGRDIGHGELQTHLPRPLLHRRGLRPAQGRGHRRSPSPSLLWDEPFPSSVTATAAAAGGMGQLLLMCSFGGRIIPCSTGLRGSTIDEASPSPPASSPSKKVLLNTEAPDLYIRQNPVPNAYTLAINGKKPFIVVHTSLVELLTPRELQAVLAHELGHLKCDHGVWLTFANILTMGAYTVPGFDMVAGFLEEQLYRWLRAAELTCDRAALVVQDPKRWRTRERSRASSPPRGCCSVPWPPHRWQLTRSRQQERVDPIRLIDDDTLLGLKRRPVVTTSLRRGLQDASYPSEQLLISGEKETQDQIYFIKQIESLGNACGTIALLHAVGNASSKVNLVENSCLDLFFKSTATMDDPHERAVCLEKDDTMARAHLLAANDGATEGMSPDVATAPKSKGCLMIGEYNKVAKNYKMQICVSDDVVAVQRSPAIQRSPYCFLTCSSSCTVELPHHGSALKEQISSTKIPARLKSGSGLCSACENFTSEAVTYLGKEQTQDRIMEFLHDACSQSFSFEQKCVELMDSYATLLFAKITEIRPEAFCKRYGLCRDTTLLSDAEFEIIQILVKECNKIEGHVQQVEQIVVERSEGWHCGYFCYLAWIPRQCEDGPEGRVLGGDPLSEKYVSSANELPCQAEEVFAQLPNPCQVPLPDAYR
uniref:Ubiquitinyl hydrolase 1 n=2 Tax=Zea mays TaxID=4577 RepID=A0A804NAF0_MAIZE